MLKKLSVLILLGLLMPGLFYAQNRKTFQKAPVIMNEPVVQVKSTGNSFGTMAANYILADSMANAYGPLQSGINPIAYDPMSNVLACVFRWNSGISSGELWYTYSTDLGNTYTKSPNNINGTTTNVAARYPSMFISNPTGGDINATLGLFTWPELTPTAFGFLGYGADLPLGAGSTFAAIDEGPPTYSSAVIPFGSDINNWLLWASTTTDNASLTLFRTEDFGTIEKSTPPTWDDAHFQSGTTFEVGGDAHNGDLYYAVLGTVVSPNPNASGVFPAYSKSTDNGATWSDWNIADFRTIPELSNYEEIWDWIGPDAFYRVTGDMIVDGNGNVHFILGVSDTLTSITDVSNAIVEVFETAPGVWDGHVIFDGGTISDSTQWDYNALNQNGYSCFISRDKDSKVYVAQWAMGTGDNHIVDLYYSYRREGDPSWTTPVNLTETADLGETISHLAPRMAADDNNNYTFFSMYVYDLTGAIPPDDLAHSGIYIAPVTLHIDPVSVDDPKPGVYSFQLSQNYPNPFNPNTSISYSIPENGIVSLKVFDVLGREVATIVNENQSAGNHTINFDASKLSSGVYVYTLYAGSKVSSQKMILMK